MRKITCNCEQTFTADLSEEADLDRTPETLNEIIDGSFLTCTCPACGSLLHTDLETRVLWPSRSMKLLMVPELSRLSVLSSRHEVPEGFDLVVGYAELADRVTVYRDQLDPLTVETLKFHLVQKALESSPETNTVVSFEGLDSEGNLNFHLHGLRNDEVAVMKVPSKLYESVRAAVTSKPQEEPQSLLRNGAYLSVQNLAFEGSDND